MLRYHSATVSISLLALALAGCNKSAPDMSAISATSAASADSSASGLPALPAALPMQTGPASQPAYAPPVAALPVRRAVSVARPANDRAAYAYLDRASDIEDEIGDAPPDYDYRNDDGVSPWVWQTNGGDYRYAEPVDNGGYRYYYYQPGAQYPYLVRTHDYSYAYAGAALVAVYALSGALLSPDHYDGYRDQASRYFWRGQQLRQASDQREHQGVIAANWAARRAQFSAAQANWAADRAQQADWRAYHAQNDPSQQPAWQQEHQQRQHVAQQFSGWQSRGLTGSPPPALAAPGRAAAGPHELYGQPGFARLDARHGPQSGRDMGGPQGDSRLAGPNPDIAAAALEHRLAAQQEEARQQAQARQGLAQKQAVLQHEAAARQQMIANVHRQQDMAAQQEIAGRQLAQQREAQGRAAQMSAHQAQLHALAAQHQAATARMQEARVHPENMGRESPQIAPVARERAPEPKRPPAAPKPAETRPPAAHEAPHPEQAPPEPPHGESGHDHEHHD